MKEQFFLSEFRRECKAVRMFAPVRLIKFHTMPGQVHAAQKLVQANTMPLGLRVSQNASCVEQGNKTMDVRVLCEQRPIEPAGFVILAIGVVVSTLRSPHFVTHEKHRHTNRKHRYGQKVFYLSVSEFLHAGIIGWTFNTAVPTSIVVRPVAVVFAICFVVFVIIRDEVVEGEPVMACYKIDALLSLTFFMTVNPRAAKQPVSKVSNRMLFPAKKTPDIISKPPIPLPPAISNKAANFIKTGRIPRFGNELGSG